MNIVEPKGWEMIVTSGLGVVLVVAVIVLVILWSKGRPFAQGEVFRASRFSTGNHILPTQVLVTPTNVVHFTPQWFGRYEHSIHMAHIASVGIDTHIIFSDVLVETTGGASPIHCKGHYKSDAVRMKELIERF
ncbi:MAG: hypothetical protein NTY02_03275, partial [Acidobacteria bacterium]|nr:hypothetical protein [Acidobacteriota bacterium]